MSDSTDPKPVVDPQKVQQPAKPKTPTKVYRFAKSDFAWEKTDLGGGVVVEWYRPKRPGTGLESAGYFTTEDEAVATKLREYAAKNPRSYIFEQT